MMPEPQQSVYRAIDVDAPAPLVWRWLCQLRCAPYSYDWIDNWGRRSPRELTPGLDDIALGQRALSFFEIAAFEPDRSITLHAKKSVFGELVVSYCVSPKSDDRSRISVKLLVTYPRRVSRVIRHVPPVGDLIMMRKQLRTLKKLAERDHARAQVADCSSSPRALDRHRRRVVVARRVDRSHSALGIRHGTRGPPRATSLSLTRHAIERSLRVVVMPATAEPLRLPRH